MNQDAESLGLRPRGLAPFVDRIEHFYLVVLRATVLLAATILLVFAAWWSISGAYKVSQSPDSVKEATAAVSADDLVKAQNAEPVSAGEQKPTATPNQQKFYAAFLNRYYQLFRTKFEPFKQAEDKVLSKDEFDDTYLKTPARLQSVVAGETDFARDRADLESLLGVLTTAADTPAIRDRLQRYKTAKKVRVARSVQRTRTEYRSGWNSYSTACENWFYSPIGCRERRAVQVPYASTDYAMEFPKGTQSHTALLHSLQDRYFTLLSGQRDANRATAQSERERIAAGNVEGSEKLGIALRTLGAFVAIMFFFLLIAIERHQRAIARRLEAAGTVLPAP